MNPHQNSRAVVSAPAASRLPANVLEFLQNVPEVPIGDAGVVLGDLKAVYVLAVIVHASGWHPKGWTQDQIAIAFLQGRRLGVDPFTALWNTAPINNRPTSFGDLVVGLCKSRHGVTLRKSWHKGEQELRDRPHFSKRDEMPDDLASVVEVLDASGKVVARERFSVADAKMAKLWSKEGPWHEYPYRMLEWRAATWALRTACPETLMGLEIYEHAIGLPTVTTPHEVVGQTVTSLSAASVVARAEPDALAEREETEEGSEAEEPEREEQEASGGILLETVAAIREAFDAAKGAVSAAAFLSSLRNRGISVDPETGDVWKAIAAGMDEPTGQAFLKLLRAKAGLPEPEPTPAAEAKAAEPGPEPEKRGKLHALPPPEQDLASFPESDPKGAKKEVAQTARARIQLKRALGEVKDGDLARIASLLYDAKGLKGMTEEQCEDLLAKLEDGSIFDQLKAAEKKPNGGKK